MCVCVCVCVCERERERERVLRIQKQKATGLQAVAVATLTKHYLREEGDPEASRLPHTRVAFVHVVAHGQDQLCTTHARQC